MNEFTPKQIQKSIALSEKTNYNMYKINTHIRTPMHILYQIRATTPAPTQIHAHARVHSHMHTRTHTPARIHTHAYTYTFLKRFYFINMVKFIIYNDNPYGM